MLRKPWSRHGSAGFALAAAAILGAAPARADDAAGAEVLFQEARKLMEAGKYADACPKFAASEKLGPAVGTLLNLADCLQQNGQTASAWTRFVEAQNAAHRANRPDREKLARDRASALEPKLARMTITVADGATAGLEVKRDGVAIDAAAFGNAVPVDPGRHVVEASAPGKKKWTVTVETIAAETVVRVPELDDAARDAPPPVAPVREKDKDRNKDTNAFGAQRTAGLIVVGVGVAGAAVGTVFGLGARSKWADAQGTHCSGTVCDPQGVALASDAKSAGTLSTVAFAVGIAGLLGGAVIYFTASSERRAAWHLAPAAGPRQAGVTVGGSF